MSVTFFILEKPEHEINMANSNAADFMHHLDPGVEFDWCGEWDQEKLKQISRRIEFLLKTELKRDLIKPTTQSGNITDCGRDADYVERRLRQFRDLVATALKHGFNVSFG